MYELTDKQRRAIKKNYKFYEGEDIKLFCEAHPLFWDHPHSAMVPAIKAYIREVKAASSMLPRRVEGQQFHLDVGKCKPVSEWKRQGKPEWPHYVRCSVPRAKAKQLLEQLIHALLETDEESIHIPFMGELTEYEE